MTDETGPGEDGNSPPGSGRDRPSSFLVSKLGIWSWRLGFADFVLLYQPGDRLQARGPVRRASLGTIEAFFEHDLKPTGPVTIQGVWGPRRMLRLRIAGPLNSFQRQRVRNVLIDVLD